MRNDHALTIYSRYVPTYHEERSWSAGYPRVCGDVGCYLSSHASLANALATPLSLQIPYPSFFFFCFEFSPSVLVRCRFLAGRIRELFVIFRSVCPGNSDVLRLAFPAAADVENVDAFKINRGTFPREKETTAPLLRVPPASDKSSTSMTEISGYCARNEPAPAAYILSRDCSFLERCRCRPVIHRHDFFFVLTVCNKVRLSWSSWFTRWLARAVTNNRSDDYRRLGHLTRIINWSFRPFRSNVKNSSRTKTISCNFRQFHSIKYIEDIHPCWSFKISNSKIKQWTTRAGNWLRTITSDRNRVQQFVAFLSNSSVRYHWIEIIEKW